MPQSYSWSFRVSWWLKRHRHIFRYLLMGVVSLLVVTVIIQLLYPTGRVLPGVKMNGQSLHGKSVAEATKQIDGYYQKAQLTIKTSDKTIAASFDEIGIDIRSNETARTAAAYSWPQRLIPFSSLFIALGRDVPVQTSFDSDRLTYFTEQVQKEGFIAAVNAGVVVKDGKASLVPAKTSKEYPAKKVASSIRSAQFAPKTTVILQPETRSAERTDDEVRNLLKEAQQAIDTPLTLTLQSETIKVDSSTIGGWLDFPEDPASKSLQLVLKAEVVAKYLGGIQTKIYRAPGTTKVQLVDGREVSRTEGVPGQGIETNKTITDLQAAVKKGQAVTLPVTVAVLAPKVVYERSYSNTDVGLAALLADLSGAKGLGISVMEVGGRSANANGNKQFVAASTYKLFVAYAIFKQIEAGQMSWSEPIGGRSADACFEVMIVKSDNPCAKAFGDKIGWQKIEDMMRSLGLSGTELSPALYTTANDLALFLNKLENGSLLSAPDKVKLVDAMKRQIYRSGIPVGTGVSVANKPGFIDSYIHDAGIVYGPKGPYALVIMTSGSSWANIADVARQVHAFLNR